MKSSLVLYSLTSVSLAFFFNTNSAGGHGLLATAGPALFMAFAPVIYGSTGLAPVGLDNINDPDVREIKRKSNSTDIFLYLREHKRYDLLDLYLKQGQYSFPENQGLQHYYDSEGFHGNVELVKVFVHNPTLVDLFSNRMIENICLKTQMEVLKVLQGAQGFEDNVDDMINVAYEKQNFDVYKALVMDPRSTTFMVIGAVPKSNRRKKNPWARFLTQKFKDLLKTIAMENIEPKSIPTDGLTNEQIAYIRAHYPIEAEPLPTISAETEAKMDAILKEYTAEKLMEFIKTPEVTQADIRVLLSKAENLGNPEAVLVAFTSPMTSVDMVKAALESARENEKFGEVVKICDENFIQAVTMIAEGKVSAEQVQLEESISEVQKGILLARLEQMKPGTEATADTQQAEEANLEALFNDAVEPFNVTKFQTFLENPAIDEEKLEFIFAKLAGVDQDGNVVEEVNQNALAYLITDLRIPAVAVSDLAKVDDFEAEFLDETFVKGFEALSSGEVSAADIKNAEVLSPVQKSILLKRLDNILKKTEEEALDKAPIAIPQGFAHSRRMELILKKAQNDGLSNGKVNKVINQYKRLAEAEDAPVFNSLSVAEQYIQAAAVLKNA